MPAYWFDVFTEATWEEARAYGLRVTGFSESKYATVRRLAEGDVLICYLKGAKKLVGALRVVGAPYFAREPRIWQGADFPARVAVAPIGACSAEEGVDFLALLPRLSVYDAGNMRSTWARFQGSPTQLTQADGELLLAAVQHRDGSGPASPAPEVPAPRPPRPEPAPRRRVAEGPARDPEPVVRVLASPLEALIAELTRAQRDAARPAAFERAVAGAFTFLGLRAEWHGQPSKTDVAIDSELGHDRYRAIVDAKASGSGKVPEGQINWAAISRHRQEAGADYAAVVGEKFADGNLQRFAAEYTIALVETAELVEVLRLYDRTPFSADDLRPLFATGGRVTAVVADLRQKAQDTTGHWRLIAEIIRQFASFSRYEPPVTLTAGSLHAVLVALAQTARGERISPPSERDVRDAVAFLSNRAVGVLRLVDPDTASYRLATSERTALERVRALGAAIHGVLDAAPAREDQGRRGEGLP